MASDTPTVVLPGPAFSNGNGAPPELNRRRVERSRQINWRLVVCSLITFSVLSPALFGWYRWQVRRHAAVLFDHGRVLYDNGAWKSASETFHRYLQFRPDDAEALLLRAQAADKLLVEPGQLPQRISLFYAAVQANPAHQDVRL